MLHYGVPSGPSWAAPTCGRNLQIDKYSYVAGHHEKNDTYQNSWPPPSWQQMTLYAN